MSEKMTEAEQTVTISDLIGLVRGCQHELGWDREMGPLGCSLGDGCVCCGIVTGARQLVRARALSEGDA